MRKLPYDTAALGDARRVPEQRVQVVWMPEVRELGWMQEVERVMQPAVGLVLLVTFVTGLVFGALVGYGWGRDDAAREIKRRRREGQCRQ